MQYLAENRVKYPSSVSLGYLLHLLPLPDGVGGLGVVASGVDDLVGQALGDGLGGSERVLSCT